MDHLWPELGGLERHHQGIRVSLLCFFMAVANPDPWDCPFMDVSLAAISLNWN